MRKRVRKKMLKRAFRKLETGQPLTRHEQKALNVFTRELFLKVTRFVTSIVDYAKTQLPEKIREWQQTIIQLRGDNADEQHNNG